MRYDTCFLLKKTACWQNKFPGKKVISYFCSCNQKNARNEEDDVFPDAHGIDSSDDGLLD